MARQPNTSGKPIRCQHCGYQWLTTSQAQYVPCPRCLYRVPNNKPSYTERAASTEFAPQKKEDLF